MRLSHTVGLKNYSDDYLVPPIDSTGGGSMSSEVLYKFRSLENWKFVLDIVIHKRLHAAPFDELNDPMEGRYY